MKRTSPGIAGKIAVIASALMIFGASGMLPQSENFNGARWGSSAVLLPDGEVLIAGGTSSSGPLNTAEIFKDGSFTSVAALSVARANAAAVMMQDGRVLVTGGTSTQSTILNSAEIYDPSSNSWSTVPSSLIEGRSGHTASLLPDGRVVLAGGMTDGRVSQSLEIFNPATGNFSFAGNMTRPRSGHAAAVLADGTVMIVGGSFNGVAPTDTTDIFNPESGEVTSGPSLNHGRTGHTATTLADGRVLIAGGNDGLTDLSSAEIYDPATETFTETGSLQTARNGHSAFLLSSGDVLIVGGAPAAPEVYRIATGTFEEAPDLHTLTPEKTKITNSSETTSNTRANLGGDGTAAITTDKTKYSSGEPMTISGTGFSAASSVSIAVLRPDHVTDTLSASTSAVGTFSVVYAPPYLPGRYKITATDGFNSANTATTEADPASVIMDQCAQNDSKNGHPLGLGNCNWIGSELNAGNAKLFEGIATDQQMLITGMDAGSHTLIFGIQATKNGKHAYDWIVSDAQASGGVGDSTLNSEQASAGVGVTLHLNRCGDELLKPEKADCNALVNGATPSNTFDIAVPDDPYLSHDGSTQTRINAYESLFGDRTIRLYTDGAIGAPAPTLSLVHMTGKSSGSVLPNGADTGDSFIWFTLTWTSAGTNALLVAGADISLGGDGTGRSWGPGTGAGSISGSPYHFYNISLDGTGGSEDNQMQSSAIFIPPDANIQITPATDTDAVNDIHTLTVHVNVNPGTGFVNAPAGTSITVTKVSGPGTITGSPCLTVSTTGSCTVTLTSATPGTTVISATTTVLVGGISLTRTTGDGLAGDSPNAQKKWVDARIQITPATDTDPTGDNHVITATVSQDDGIPAGAPGDAVTGFGPAPNGTLVTFSLLNNNAGATFVGGNTCTTTAGTCTVTITGTAGGVDIHATTTFSVGGVSLTRATGDGLSGDSANAHKTFVDARITLTPLTDTDPNGDNHVITATVSQNDGIPAGAPGDAVTGFGPAPNGTLVTFSLLNNNAGATFVGGNTCTTTAGTCTVTITGANGSVDIHATITFLVGGVSLTRATGDGLSGDSGNAHKTFIGSSTTLTLESQTPAGANQPIGTLVTIVVRETNTGGTSLTGVNVTGGGKCASFTGGATTLAPGASTLFTCTFTVTAGANAWSADGHGTDQFGTPVPATGEHAEGSIQGLGSSTTLVLASQTPAGANQPVGTLITIVVTETNTGTTSLSGVNVTGGGKCASFTGGATTLAPLASTNFTCTFTVTAGANAWFADGHGTDQFGTPVPDAGEHAAGSVQGLTSSTTLVLASQSPAGANQPVGTLITIVVTETNTGTTSLSGVNVTGGGKCASFTGGATTLAPLASTNFTCTFTVTAGANAWFADGHGTDQFGTPVPDAGEHAAGSVQGLTSSTTLVLASQTPAGANQPVGTLITIVVTETNTGTTSLSGVNVTGGGKCASFTGGATTLAPLASTNFTCTFTVTAGTNAWFADGHGTDQFGTPVPSAGEHAEGSVQGLGSSTTLVLASQSPAGANQPVGTLITIVVTETNTGTTSLSGVNVTGGGKCASFTGGATTLAPLASTNFTCTFTVTAGTNAWFADGHGTDQFGTPVPDAGEHAAGSVQGLGSSTTLVLASQSPAGANQPVGTLITIVVTETNTGTTSLSGVNVTGGGKCASFTGGATTLAPLASTNFTCTFTVTAGANAWFADGHGTDQFGTPVPDAGEHAAGSVQGLTSSTTLVLASQTPAGANQPVGTLITIVVTETNTGTTSLSGVNVTGGGKCASFSGGATTLAPLASTNFTCTFTVTAGANAWFADGHGTDQFGTPVPDAGEHAAGSVQGLTSSTTLVLASQTPAGANQPVGTLITIVVTETNTGTTSLSGVNVTGGGVCATFTGGAATLAPGASTVFTCTFTTGAGANVWFADGHGTDQFGNPVPAAGEHASGSVTGTPVTGKTITMGPQSMEGAISISNGDWVNGGYSFKTDFTANIMIAATITITGPCSNGGIDTVTVDLGTRPYAAQAGTDWKPTGDANSVLSWQGAVQVGVNSPAICGGVGELDASKGAVFVATITGAPSGGNITFRFKYRDPFAKGKPNTNCLDTTDPNRNKADVCGASWSATKTFDP